MVDIEKEIRKRARELYPNYHKEEIPDKALRNIYNERQREKRNAFMDGMKEMYNSFHYVSNLMGKDATPNFPYPHIEIIPDAYGIPGSLKGKELGMYLKEW